MKVTITHDNGDTRVISGVNEVILYTITDTVVVYTDCGDVEYCQLSKVICDGEVIYE